MTIALILIFYVGVMLSIRYLRSRYQWRIAANEVDNAFVFGALTMFWPLTPVFFIFVLICTGIEWVWKWVANLGEKHRKQAAPISPKSGMYRDEDNDDGF